MLTPLEMIENLSNLMAKKAGVRGRSFARQFKKAPRVFPRRLRADARTIAAAQTLCENPKLARRIDLTELNHSYGNLLEYLQNLNPSERRKTVALGWLAGLVVNLFLLAGVVLAVVYYLRQM